LGIFPPLQFLGQVGPIRPAGDIDFLATVAAAVAAFYPVPNTEKKIVSTEFGSVIGSQLAYTVTQVITAGLLL
jgi:hypothetical protein